MHNLEGQTIKGYDLQERIGAGGFGAVYRAMQSTVGREVAVKIILPGLANQPDFIRRFESEAHLIARLEHPYIVPLYDYWRDPDGAYLVMRWLRGGNLHEMLKSQGGFSVEETVTMMEQITQALHTAHRSQVIHRDIKPANILLDDDGNAYLADFGIAKDHTIAKGVTEADAVLGSLDYIAPEQARSEPVTPQTDIYSLGVVLYEMLAGEHPFPKLSLIDQLFKHLNTSLPDIMSLDDNIRDSLNAVIQKATAKNPQERFKDVLEFVQSLRAAARLGTGEVTPSLVELLTPREQEVLQLMIEGKSNREIADVLVVEVATIKWYNKQIYRKLNVRSRVQAIVKARELELVLGKHNGATATTGHLPEPENPYKGLRAFQAADAQDFFGREKLVQKLLHRLQEDVQFKRFLAIVGPSGSGKSSVVRAGLIPALWRGELKGSDKWYIVDMLPGDRPLDELEVALLRVAGDHSLNIRDHLERDAHGLIRAANLILPDDGSELLLVIDQFEEVFTLVENETDRQHFLNLLLKAATKERSRVRVVVTLRADYYDRPLQYPEFGELMRNRVETVLPLGASELERAIREPALMEGVQFEDGLVSRIVADVNYQPGALPLLQYALTELFERRKGRTLTQAAYVELGGTGGALAKRADELYLERDENGREQIRQLFLRLVTLGEGAEDTRRRVLRSELLNIAAESEVMDDIIDTYAASRLLALDHDPATRQPTAEVAHEAILREWDRLRAWLNESREDIRQQRIVAHAAEAWQTNHRDTSYLLRGTRLAQVEKWHQATELALTPLEREFIESSIQEHLADAESESERRKRETALEQVAIYRLRIAVAVFAVASIVGLILAAIAIQARNTAASERDNAIAQRATSDWQAAYADAQRLGFQARAVDETGQSVLALALAIEGNRQPNPPPDAVRVLAELSQYPILQRTWQAHETLITALAFTTDGRMAISAACREQRGSRCSESELRLWDVSTGELVREMNGHRSSVIALAISADGQLALSSANDNSVILWDISSGQILHSVEGRHGEFIVSLAFSLDGQYFATGSASGQLALHNSSTGERLFTLQLGSKPLASIAFSPTESLLLIGSIGFYEPTAIQPDNDPTLSSAGRLYWVDTENGSLLRHIAIRGGMINDINFDVESQSVMLTVGFTRYILDVATGNSLRSLVSDNTIIIPEHSIVERNDLKVGISPDDTIGLTTMPTQIILWDLNTGSILWVADIPIQTNAAISMNSLSVITATSEGEIAFYQFPRPDQLYHYAVTQRTIPPLTCDERSSYGIRPLCNETGQLPPTPTLYPTNTPFPIATPLAVTPDE
jgi:serine/threonine protein kinase/WD40 repeat protein